MATTRGRRRKGRDHFIRTGERTYNVMKDLAGHDGISVAAELEKVVIGYAKMVRGDAVAEDPADFSPQGLYHRS